MNTPSLNLQQRRKAYEVAKKFVKNQILLENHYENFVCNLLVKHYKEHTIRPTYGYWYVDIETEFPEFYKQMPRNQWDKDSPWWTQTRRGDLARVAALERAIALCDNQLNKK